MSMFVVCPNCSAENSGSALLCSQCQTSLIDVQRQERPDALPAAVPTAEAGSERTEAIFINTTRMMNEIRSWAFWSLGLGAMSLFSAGILSSPWGVLLIIVGAGSFFFPSASMFVIYSATLGWAGFSNIIGLNSFWIFLGIYQVYLAYQVFRKYRFYRDTEDVSQTAQASRASRVFPWFSAFFGCIAFIGLVLSVLIVFLVAIGSKGTRTAPAYFDFIIGLTENLGVLAVATGAASLLSKYRSKVLAIVGIVAGVLTVGLYFLLVILL
jgi:hypothetical protein